jgi:hypothetical protein
MTTRRPDAGFTAVELLITLFVAAAFLIAAYQLFNVVIRDGGQARAESRAGNVAYDYLRQYSNQATNPCVAFNPVVNSDVAVAGLDKAIINVSITCPDYSTTGVSKVEVKLDYNTPAQTVRYSTLVNGSSAQDADLIEGLIAWWKLNGDANSSVGSAHGTVYGAVPAEGQGGQPNTAYTFNGSTNYIDAQIQNSGGDLVHSISIWVRPHSLNTGVSRVDPLTIGNAANTSTTSLDIAPNLTGWYFYNNDTNYMAALPINTWTHIALTYQGGGGTTTNKRMYINGVQVALSSNGVEYGQALRLPANSNIGIGYDRGRNNAFFDGEIDDIRIYNRVISSTEVSTLFQRGAQ